MSEELKRALDRLDALADPNNGMLAVPANSATATAIRADLALLRAALTQRPAAQAGEREAPYGYCPECGAPGVMRERRPDGDDKCSNGHRYPSHSAHTSLPTQPAQQATPDQFADASKMVQATPEPTPEHDMAGMLERGAKAWSGVDPQEIRAGGQATPEPVGEPSVTLASALAAIEHVAMHNGPGRATGAKSLLKATRPAPGVPEAVQDLINKAKKLGNGNNPAAYREALTDIGRAILAAAQAKGGQA